MLFTKKAKEPFVSLFPNNSDVALQAHGVAKREDGFDVAHLLAALYEGSLEDFCNKYKGFTKEEARKKFSGITTKLGRGIGDVILCEARYGDYHNIFTLIASSNRVEVCGKDSIKGDLIHRIDYLNSWLKNQRVTHEDKVYDGCLWSQTQEFWREYGPLRTGHFLITREEKTFPANSMCPEAAIHQLGARVHEAVRSAVTLESRRLEVLPRLRLDFNTLQHQELHQEFELSVEEDRTKIIIARGYETSPKVLRVDYMGGIKKDNQEYYAFDAISHAMKERIK